MDYDDLVDQFIVNDAEPVSSNENNTSPNTNTNDNSSPKVDSEVIKLHMRNLIQARQQARQVLQFERVKERNKSFVGVIKKSTASATGSGNSGNIYSAGNSEKRRRILAGMEVIEDSSKAESSEGTEVTETDNMDSDSVAENTTQSTTPTINTSEMIPCRLELDYEGYKLSDVFMLPSTPTPSQSILNSIASQICQDYDLPADLFQPAIVKCLKDQVEEWHVYQGALEGMKVPYEEIGAVPMRLDVIVGLHRIEDRLEISLDPKDSNTETMSRFVEELKSPDENILTEKEYAAFRPLILHNLLEQLMLWRKAIVFGGYHRDPRSNNLKFHDGDVAVLLNDPKTSTSTVRRHFADTNSFTPILSVLTVEELDKIEAGRERESRRRRRTVSTAGSTGATGKRSTASSSAMIGNNLTGTVRSPPRTLPTPTSYRGSLHRIQQSTGSDDEAPRKRGRKAKY